MNQNKRKVALAHQDMLKKYGIQLFLNDGSMVTEQKLVRDIYVLTKVIILTESQENEIDQFLTELFKQE